ncbi:MAG: hypothetical protein B0D91_04875 [Oceanospirillales bacterium LUC14_002_19_P2]|nr:MAG: hypothetical protein B0D91_04875 [Oceanospirillales bacterium LUC14_002_19_P2]
MPNAYDPTPHLWDKIKHFAAFFLLAALFDQGWPKQPTPMSKFLLLALYGLLVECLQAFTPDRHFSLLDLAADAAGIATYAGAAVIIHSFAGGNAKTQSH